MSVKRPDLKPGDSVDAIETPALIVDLDAFEANLTAMADFARARGIRLRPHGKTHKCAAIGLRQMQLGAVGLCCQKVSEAEALVAGGVGNVLVTNEVLGPAKLQRLVALTAKAEIGICIDSNLGLDRLTQAMASAPRPMDVYLELDVGAGRCGVIEIADAVALVERIVGADKLRFGGIHAYQGSAQHLRTQAERRKAIDFAAGRAGALKTALEARGITVPVITGAGTGTFPIEAASGVYTEIQPGSYIFMDRDYGDNQPDPAAPIFAHSLFVLTSVMSRRAEFAVIDAGLKSHSIDSGFPTVSGFPELSFDQPSDEHGVIRGSQNALPNLDDKLRLIPGHCDPTVNLYDWIIAVRGDKVAEIWPVDARGALT